MAAWTSRAAPSTFRSRLNWIVIAAPPSVLTEVISETPEIWPSLFSRGAATVEATVAGSAPGKFAETLIIGKSTRGIGATGRKWYAITPARNNPAASSDVPAGRLIKGSEMFTRHQVYDAYPRGALSAPAPDGASGKFAALRQRLDHWPNRSMYR
jgi:hypothetical protein